MKIYHFTDCDNIEVFKHTKPKRTYSQASGKGIYFATNYEKGMMKYGRRSKYCYECEFTGDNILDLGEFDSMYFDGRIVHASSLVSENFRIAMENMKKAEGEKRLKEIPEPQILIENISTKAFNWLKKKGIQAVKGMDGEGYACPEFCVIDSSCIKILSKKEI